MNNISAFPFVALAAISVSPAGDPPTVSILNAPAGFSTLDPFQVTIAFSQAVSGFVVGDIAVGNGTASNLQTSDNITFTADITPDGNGDVTIDVAANVATNLLNQPNTAATQVVVPLDTDSPSVAILNAPASVSTLDPFQVTIRFSEAVTGFSVGDIAVGNGAASNLKTSDNISFTADITPDGNGDVTIDVAAGVATDGAGNPNTAATRVVVGVADDTQGPSVEIVGAPASFGGDLAAFAVTVRFSEAVTGFDAGDVKVGHGSVTGFTATNASEYAVEITPDGSGDVTIDVAANVAQDASGNGNSAAAQVTVASTVVEETQQVIASFMQNRANFLLGNQPDFLDYLSGNNTVGGGQLGSLSLDGNRDGMNLAFSTSLSKLDAEAARAMLERQAAGPAEDDGPSYEGLPGTASRRTAGLPAAADASHDADNDAGAHAGATHDVAARMAPAEAATDGVSHSPPYNPSGSMTGLSAYSADDGMTAQSGSADLDGGRVALLSLMPQGADNGDGLDRQATMPDRRYDIWTEVYGARASSGPTESSYGLTYLGAHYFLTPDFILGALVQLDWASEDADPGTSSTTGSSADGFGWMVGPYVAARMPGTALGFEARAAWGRSDNEVSPFRTYSDSFETERMLLSAKVQGTFDIGAVTMTPSARVSWFEETQQAYVDSLSNTIPEQTVSLGEVRFGPEFSRTIDPGDGSLLVPSFGIYGVWNFDVDDNPTLQPAPLGDEDLRARLDFGLKAANAYGWILSASAYYDGIGLEDYQTIGAKVRLVIPVR